MIVHLSGIDLLTTSTPLDLNSYIYDGKHHCILRWQLKSDKSAFHKTRDRLRWLCYNYVCRAIPWLLYHNMLLKYNFTPALLNWAQTLYALLFWCKIGGLHQMVLVHITGNPCKMGLKPRFKVGGFFVWCKFLKYKYAWQMAQLEKHATWRPKPYNHLRY